MVTIALKVRPETKAELEALAASEARSSSQLARFAIEDGLVLIKANGLKTTGRRRRTAGGADKVVRSVSSRRGKIDGFKERNSLAGRRSGERGILNHGGVESDTPSDPALRKRTKDLPPAA